MALQQELSFVLLGFDIALFCLATYKALRLFRHGCRMLTFLSAGLVCGMAQAVIGVGMADRPVSTLVLVFSPFWFITVQATTWIYVFRIQTLRVMAWMDAYVVSVPWIILCGQIPVIVLFNLDIYLGGVLTFTLAVGLVYDTTVILLEVGLFVALLKKVLCLLEYRPNFKKRFQREMMGTCLVVVLGDVARMTTFLLADQPLIIVVSATTYLFRLLVIVYMYDILVEEVRGTPLMI